MEHVHKLLIIFIKIFVKKNINIFIILDNFEFVYIRLFGKWEILRLGNFLIYRKINKYLVCCQIQLSHVDLLNLGL